MRDAAARAEEGRLRTEQDMEDSLLGVPPPLPPPPPTPQGSRLRRVHTWAIAGGERKHARTRCNARAL